MATLVNNITAAMTTIEDAWDAALEKGATPPTGATRQDLPALVASIPAGGGITQAQFDGLIDGEYSGDIYTEATEFRANALQRIPDITKITAPYCANFATGAVSQSSTRGSLIVSVDVGVVSRFEATSFSYNTNLSALILRGNSVSALTNVNAFQGTPIANGTGYIYVPAALVDSYKAATNWVTYVSQIAAIEGSPYEQAPY